MKKLIARGFSVFLAAAALLAAVLVLAGCGGGAGTGPGGKEEEDTEYDVKFYTNYGDNELFKQITVLNGTKVEKPIINPGREGYRFTDWYTESGKLHKYDFNETVEGNISLYAGWSNSVVVGADLEYYQL